MRLSSFVILFAACSSHPSGSPDATNPPDGVISLTCGTRMADYCAATSCDLTLIAAEQDKSLCPASLTTCGDYELITKGGIDTSTTFYYQAGELVAIDHTLIPGRSSCLAGPAMFDAPTCATANHQMLPACPASTP